jgi:hypothetical protein
MFYFLKLGCSSNSRDWRKYGISSGVSLYNKSWFILLNFANENPLCSHNGLG